VSRQARHNALCTERAQLNQQAEILQSKSGAGLPSDAAPDEAAAAASLEQVGFTKPWYSDTWQSGCCFICEARLKIE